MIRKVKYDGCNKCCSDVKYWGFTLIFMVAIKMGVIMKKMFSIKVLTFGRLPLPI